MKKTWKKLTASLLCMVMLLSIMPVHAAAASGTCGRNLTWSLSGKGVLTISGSGPMAEFDEYYDAPWYRSRSSIKSVKIGSAVTKISENAFYNCKNLTSVSIPASVTEIEEKAFYNCDSLTGVVIGSGVREIGEKAFYDCDGLTKVTIPAGVREIDERAFGSCGALKKILFKGNAPELESDTFRGVTAIVNYPANNATWNHVRNRNYGGTLTWKTIGDSADAPAADTVTAPTLKASNVASTGKIQLTWNAVDGASTYKVYRADGKNGAYKLLKTLSGTKLTNTSTTAGKLYNYYVVAVASDGTLSKRSNIVSRTCDLPRPEVTVKLNRSGDPVVTWNPIKGADEYNVYIYNASGKLIKTADTEGTRLTHTSAVPGNTYKYRVVAEHDRDAADSARSPLVSIKAK